VRLLVLEYITGGGMMGQDLPPALAREGDLMATALLRELAEIPGVNVVSTRDPRLAPPVTPTRFVMPAPGDDPWEMWERAADQADAVWPIAPETDGILERMSRIAAARGRRLLGSTPESVKVTGSKRATYDVLARCGVPVVETRLAAELPDSAAGWVVKPDDGVGGEDTRIFDEPGAIGAWLIQQEEPRRYVVQPFLAGEPASLSVLFRDGESRVLSCNRQDVARENGGFRYRGFDVGAREDARSELEQIAAAVAKALPGLFGYAGIDVMMTEAGPVVLEINPRLTTSYAGLGAALGRNVAELVLGLASGHDMPKLRPKRSVRVELNGSHG
jgi:predicted ATP-grasp superfamily ATP-dependent carboligase